MSRSLEDRIAFGVLAAEMPGAASERGNSVVWPRALRRCLLHTSCTARELPEVARLTKEKLATTYADRVSSRWPVGLPVPGSDKQKPPVRVRDQIAVSAVLPCLLPEPVLDLNEGRLATCVVGLFDCELRVRRWIEHKLLELDRVGDELWRSEIRQGRGR